jgi:nitrogen regulatory protein P-II 1
MKEVRAYIKPHRLSEVIAALYRIEGLTGASVVHAHGFGRTRSPDAEGGSDGFGFGEPHEKIEVVCKDTLTEDVVAAIEQAAHTGLRGDGKIYVSTVEEAVRIATGERGDLAV